MAAGGTMRRFQSPLILLGAFGIGLIFDLFLDKVVPDSSIRQLLMLAACNVMIAVSLNVINGMAGQFSIGHAGFVGLGAYASAILAANLHQRFGGGDVTFARSLLIVPLAMIAGGVIAGLAGLVVGLPSLRLKGDYLAIVTLGFAEIVRLTIATAKPSTGEALGTICGRIRTEGIVSGTGSCVSAAISRLGGQNCNSFRIRKNAPCDSSPMLVTACGIRLSWQSIPRERSSDLRAASNGKARFR